MAIIGYTAAPNNGQTRLPALVARARQAFAGVAPPDNGLAGGGGSGLTAVHDLTDQAKAQAAATTASTVPDNYAAVLRELARARTQMMIRNTNGQRGSLSGAGTSVGQLVPGSAPGSPISAPSTATGLQQFRTAINNRARLL